MPTSKRPTLGIKLRAFQLADHLPYPLPSSATQPLTYFFCLSSNLSQPVCSRNKVLIMPVSKSTACACCGDDRGMPKRCTGQGLQPWSWATHILPSSISPRHAEGSLTVRQHIKQLLWSFILMSAYFTKKGAASTFSWFVWLLFNQID